MLKTSWLLQCKQAGRQVTQRCCHPAQTSGTERPLWERTECSDSSSPLVPFIKETVRKDTMQENTNHPSHQAERSSDSPFHPSTPTPIPQCPSTSVSVLRFFDWEYQCERELDDQGSLKSGHLSPRRKELQAQSSRNVVGL